MARASNLTEKIEPSSVAPVLFSKGTSLMDYVRRKVFLIFSLPLYLKEMGKKEICPQYLISAMVVE